MEMYNLVLILNVGKVFSLTTTEIAKGEKTIFVWLQMPPVFH